MHNPRRLNLLQSCLPQLLDVSNILLVRLGRVCARSLWLLKISRRRDICWYVKLPRILGVMLMVLIIDQCPRDRSRLRGPSSSSVGVGELFRHVAPGNLELLIGLPNVKALQWLSVVILLK